MNVWVIIYNIVGLFLTSSLGVAVINWVFEKVEGNKVINKSERRRIALDIVEEVVVFVQQNFKGGTTQRTNAIKLIDQRFKDNGWDKHFTVAQIEQMTEAIYKSLKLKGVLR